MALNTRSFLLAAMLAGAAPLAVLAQDASPTPTATPTPATTSTPAEAPAPTEAPAATVTPTPEANPTVTPAPEASPAAGATPAAGAAPDAAQGVGPTGSGVAASAAEAEVGQYYVVSQQGDWVLRCVKAPEGSADPCELYQLLRDKSGNPVSEVSVIALKGGQAVAGATMIAPLETDLGPGIGVKIDSGKQLAYPFSFCAPVGCVARIGFTQAELDAMKRGNVATVSLMPYGAPADARVDLPLSLKGFTAGLDALTAKAAAAPAQASPTPAP